MSHNPKTIKSQDDLNPCNFGKRSSDVVLSAVDKCELLQKQLDIAVKGIKAVLDDELFCETADGGLIMYLYTALDRIEELNK